VLTNASVLDWTPKVRQKCLAILAAFGRKPGVSNTKRENEKAKPLDNLRTALGFRPSVVGHGRTAGPSVWLQTANCEL
jgi:hypothetical protein